MNASSVHHPANNDGTLDEGIVAQAVQWYVCLSSGMQTEADHRAFAHWHDTHADHARAWQRMQALGLRMQGSKQYVQPELARTTLLHTRSGQGRRAALKTLFWIGTGTTTAYMVQGAVPWRSQWDSALADAATTTGEQRHITLADGTHVLLNTATAIDIHFDAHERRIVLRHGEIMVTTARDAAARPLVVVTGHGTLTPVGTRFTVRRDDPANAGVVDTTHLAVMEGAVQITPAKRRNVLPVLVRAGQQTSFTQEHVLPFMLLDEVAQSWTTGTLIAEGMRLEDFIGQLRRYRTGRLRCTPGVADLRITGVWPLNGTDHILASLERHLPVRIDRMTRYWVTVSAR